jgi:hypothetical protein
LRSIAFSFFRDRRSGSRDYQDLWLPGAPWRQGDRATFARAAVGRVRPASHSKLVDLPSITAADEQTHIR